MNDWSQAREQIASALRDLRAEAGLSTTELAGQLDWSQSQVSRTELGKKLAKPADVAAWSRATGAPEAVREELVAIAERAAGEFTDWRRELAPGRRRVQEEIQRLEEQASVTRVFAMDVVPGLAQTRPYIETMFRLGREIGPVDEPTEEAVRARIARQTVLGDRTKRFYLLMSEMAVRRQLISRLEMRAQLERLIEIDRQRNVTVGVIPFDAVERVHQYHAFAILGDPDVDHQSIAMAESVTRAINIRARNEIKLYIAHFESLRSAALEGAELRRFLREVVAELPA